MYLEHKAEIRCPYHVYFLLPKIKRPDRVKIGFTDNLARRIRQLTNQCGQELVCIYSIDCAEEQFARDIEKYLHEAFNDYRLKGEWFKFTPEVYCLIPYLSGDLIDDDAEEDNGQDQH